MTALIIGAAVLGAVLSRVPHMARSFARARRVVDNSAQLASPTRREPS